MTMSLFEAFLPVSPNSAIAPEQLAASSLGQYRDHWIEEKYDGSLYIARFYLDGRVTFKSRRISVTAGGACDRTEQLYRINRAAPVLGGSLLVGEVMPPEGINDHGVVNKLLLSGPNQSRLEQERIGNLRYIGFDCLWDHGEDIREWPLERRRLIANLIIEVWRDALDARSGADQLVRLSPLYSGSALEKFHEIVARGGEGVMLKDPRRRYGYGVVKCKKANDVSVFIADYQPGNGKYGNSLGSLVCAAYAGEQVVELGKASGMSDSDRDRIWRNRDQYLYRVFDVRCQPPNYPETWDPLIEKLRNARFVRWREDLDASQCTVAKIQRDFLTFKQGGGN